MNFSDKYCQFFFIYFFYIIILGLKDRKELILIDFISEMNPNYSAQDVARCDLWQKFSEIDRNCIISTFIFKHVAYLFIIS